MEPRKIIKFGNSSYVITLPFSWLKENNLGKGDSINLSQNKNSILLTKNVKIEEKRAKINIDDKVLKLFNRELISYYLKNFKYIKIEGKNIIERVEEIRVLKNKLSSLEIVEINTNSITLKDLSNPNDLEITSIINEIVEMEKMLFQELLKEDKSKVHFLISNLDKNINKLSFLGYKAINYNLDTWKNSEEIKNEIYYWRIISSFETVGDIIKRIARYLKNTSSEENHHLNNNLEEFKKYFEFVTNLLSINTKVSLDNNLKLYLDKKQSLLREIEALRENFKNNLNLYLVISQLLKDILGKLDDVILSIIDINCEL